MWVVGKNRCMDILSAGGFWYSPYGPRPGPAPLLCKIKVLSFLSVVRWVLGIGYWIVGTRYWVAAIGY